MARKITTLFIRDNSINLLVMKGRRVEKWASLLLEPGLVSQGVVLDEAQVAGKVTELFKLEKVRKREVIAGFFAVLFTWFGINYFFTGLHSHK